MGTGYRAHAGVTIIIVRGAVDVDIVVVVAVTGGAGTDSVGVRNSG